MSDSAVFEGYCRVAELGAFGMISIRGDLDDADFVGAVQHIAECDVPGARQITDNGQHALAWMAPDELLYLLPHPEAEGKAAGP